MIETIEYQREKTEISADIDKLEMEQLQDVRIVRDKIIEQEVESRKVKADCEKIFNKIKKEEDNQKSSIDKMAIQKKQLQ